MSSDKTGTNISIATPRHYLHYDSRIEVSIERLKNLLNALYEAARSDAEKVKIYKYYNVFFSVSFTLAIPLLTATFNDFLSFSATFVRNCAIVLCVVSLIIGIIFVIVNSNTKIETITEERDQAVEDALSTIKEESFNIKSE